VAAFLSGAGALQGLVSGPHASHETRGAFLDLLGGLLDAGAAPFLAALAPPEPGPAAPGPQKPRFAPPGAGGASSKQAAEGASALVDG
jgi:hypothetical protein